MQVIAKTSSAWYEVTAPDRKHGYMDTTYLVYDHIEIRFERHQLVRRCDKCCHFPAMAVSLIEVSWYSIFGRCNLPKCFYQKYDIFPSSSVCMGVGGDHHVSNVTGPDTAPNRDQRFERLVDQYQESVLRTCFLYLCDKTLAEDATQETFLKVYRAMDSFRGESSEKTWVLKIAMHTCYDINHSGWFRLMNRRVTPEMLPDQSSTAVIDHDEELATAVMKLPRKLREVILLHYYQELNVNEIAVALGISHSSVSGRLKRGREKLKKLLEGREIDE